MTQYRFANGKRFNAWVLYWQPTLTAHDPNPPITLEDESEPPGESSAPYGFLQPMGIFGLVYVIITSSLWYRNAGG